MVIAYHVIFGAYGFWLPNDPRGSWSDFVGSWELFRYGPATKTTEVRSVAHCQHDIRLRLAAKESLQHPPVRFNGIQAKAIGEAFGRYASNSGLVIRACAILPEHVHLVVDRFRISIEQIVIQLKGDATEELLRRNLHPFGQERLSNGKVPKCWARGEWKCFIDSEEDLCRAIRYVEENPIKEGKRRQHWSFITPFRREAIAERAGERAPLPRRG
jgi:REP element-mobilizing transposase RayT